MKAFQPRHLTDGELIAAIEHTAERHPSRRVLTHLADCGVCQERQAALQLAILDTVASLRSGAAGEIDRRARRAQLEGRLTTETQRMQLQFARRARLSAAVVARWSTAVVLVVAVLVTARALRSRSQPNVNRAPAPVERDVLPIASLTPGATANLTVDQLCRGEHRDVEPADPAVRARVLKDYGMADVPQHEYELDYLITPALGGANDRRNLWPERYTDRTWNAKVKDQLEELLPTLLCQGQIDLRTAQRDIAANWVEAYKKYFKTQVPLRSGT